MTLTSKVLILFYSGTGNTKAIVKKSNTYDFDLIDISPMAFDFSQVDFAPYDIVLIGTSTWGAGMPPKPFLHLTAPLKAMSGKQVGLFGSGQSLYEYYCGGLDLIEDVLKEKNNILFKYRFESYPTKKAFNEFQQYLDDVKKLSIDK